ncbi:hypothetical protein [Paenarthrobacter sp. NPDC057981]|uniref:hypothetical protein n=1 Tax=Paenarthrobacter sp. NPDC057981 TaxID=3346297 RepID=UPI0036DCA051
MKTQIGRLCMVAGTVLAISLGSVTAASASPGTTAVPAVTNVTPKASLAADLRLTWNKTVAFAGCITSVGVPIGAAWAIATNPGAIAWIIGRGPLPASVGGGASAYLSYVKRTCGYAIFNIVYR